MTPAASAAAKATKLHNPYEGQVSAKQLNETMDHFLSRLPPATTDVTPDIPWIYVANPFIPREGGGGVEEAPAESGAQLNTFIEGGGERLELFGDFLRTVDEKKRGSGGGGGRVSAAMGRQVTAEREGAVNDILMLARVMKVRTGKASLFPPHPVPFPLALPHAPHSECKPSLLTTHCSGCSSSSRPPSTRSGRVWHRQRCATSSGSPPRWRRARSAGPPGSA